MNHILIAYFSRAGENYFGGKIKSVEVGNTEICAKELKKAIEADLFKIEMKEPYSDNYKKCVAQAMKDMTIKRRPELKKLPESIEPYDTIVLGYPNYCGSMPQGSKLCPKRRIRTVLYVSPEEFSRSLWQYGTGKYRLCKRRKRMLI